MGFLDTLRREVGYLRTGMRIWIQIKRDAAAQEEEANPPAASGFASDRLRNTPAPESTQNAAPARYTVRPGDTPLGIALSHSIALNDLLRANGLSEDDFLQIGQTLEIPGAGEEAAEAAAEPATAAQPEAQEYTVRPGDTILAIAIRLDVDWRVMLRANDLTEQSLLQPGQVLVIP